MSFPIKPTEVEYVTERQEVNIVESTPMATTHKAIVSTYSTGRVSISAVAVFDISIPTAVIGEVISEFTLPVALDPSKPINALAVGGEGATSSILTIRLAPPSLTGYIEITTIDGGNQSRTIYWNVEGFLLD